jgi:hypothetical protein
MSASRVRIPPSPSRKPCFGGAFLMDSLREDGRVQGAYALQAGSPPLGSGAAFSGRDSATMHGRGGVAERSNAAVSKTVSGFWVRRGFKSLPLRSVGPDPAASAGFRPDLPAGCEIRLSGGMGRLSGP